MLKALFWVTYRLNNYQGSNFRSPFQYHITLQIIVHMFDRDLTS